MEAGPDSAVIGRGLIATALRPVSQRYPGTLFFAAGTGDSACRDRNPFDREQFQLAAAIEHCRLRDLRLVYCSSAGAVYGDFSGLRDEQTPCRPKTPYGAHKLVCESQIRTSNIRHLILRISNLVGPAANPGQLVPNLVQQILSGVVWINQMPAATCSASMITAKSSVTSRSC